MRNALKISRLGINRLSSPSFSNLAYSSAYSSACFGRTKVGPLFECRRKIDASGPKKKNSIDLNTFFCPPNGPNVWDVNFLGNLSKISGWMNSSYPEGKIHSDYLLTKTWFLLADNKMIKHKSGSNNNDIVNANFLVMMRALDGSEHPVHILNDRMQCENAALLPPSRVNEIDFIDLTAYRDEVVKRIKPVLAANELIILRPGECLWMKPKTITVVYRDGGTDSLSPQELKDARTDNNVLIDASGTSGDIIDIATKVANQFSSVGHSFDSKFRAVNKIRVILGDNSIQASFAAATYSALGMQSIVELVDGNFHSFRSNL